MAPAGYKTIQQFARDRKVSTCTIWKRVKANQIDYVQLMGHYYIPNRAKFELKPMGRPIKAAS